MSLFDRSPAPAGPLSRAGLLVIALTVIADQATKLIADALMPLGSEIPLLPFLTLLRVNNTGIALSFLAAWSPLFLVGVMVAVTIAVLVMWIRAEDGGALANIGFALIVGGAIGNLIDRARLGHVIDFLFLHLGDRPLFVFNLADVALSIGPALLVVLYLWPGSDRDG